MLRCLMPTEAKPHEQTEVGEELTAADHNTRLADGLGKPAAFSYAALCATVLRSDFGESYNEHFRKQTLALITHDFGFSDGTVTGIEGHLNSAQSEDLVTLITAIKSDSYVTDNGGLVISADLVSRFVRTGNYDARLRVLIRHISALLGVDWNEVEDCEKTLAAFLQDTDIPEESDSEESNINDDRKARKKRDRNKKIKRWAMIGAGATVGGVLIGLTGGLAAPLFAAGAGVFVGSAAAAGIATVSGAAVLGSIFGVAGAGLAGFKVQKRVGAIEEFLIEPLTEGRSLTVAVAVCGWICDEREDNFRYPWRHLAVSDEQYCLRYESKYLLELGKAVEYLMSWAVSYGIQQTLMQTALSGLVAAIAWPMSILTIAAVVDNPWNVCMRRSVEVGACLAQVLISRQQGCRPVTLLGFSLGARVIYHCLLEMSKRKDCEGIVEDVILLGAPVAGSPSEWTKVARVVAGRIINGYCTNDWLLKFLYRTMNLQFSIAGIAPVNAGIPKIMNVNLSHLIESHSDYQHKLTQVLEVVGVRVKERGSAGSTPSREVMVVETFPTSLSQTTMETSNPTVNNCA